MSNINVSLPEPMREWVEAQIKQGRYGNLSEYVRDLIRRDQQRSADDRLEALLLEGLNSLAADKGIEVTSEYMERKRHELNERIRLRRAAKPGGGV
jgi:antitoxin ParD1/3/4